MAPDLLEGTHSSKHVIVEGVLLWRQWCGVVYVCMYDLFKRVCRSLLKYKSASRMGNIFMALIETYNVMSSKLKPCVLSVDGFF